MIRRYSSFCCCGVLGGGRERRREKEEGNRNRVTRPNQTERVAHLPPPHPTYTHTIPPLRLFALHLFPPEREGSQPPPPLHHTPPFPPPAIPIERSHPSQVHQIGQTVGFLVRAVCSRVHSLHDAAQLGVVPLEVFPGHAWDVDHLCALLAAAGARVSAGSLCVCVCV